MPNPTGQMDEEVKSLLHDETTVIISPALGKNLSPGKLQEGNK